MDGCEDIGTLQHFEKADDFMPTKRSKPWSNFSLEERDAMV